MARSVEAFLYNLGKELSNFFSPSIPMAEKWSSDNPSLTWDPVEKVSRHTRGMPTFKNPPNKLSAAAESYRLSQSATHGHLSEHAYMSFVNRDGCRGQGVKAGMRERDNEDDYSQMSRLEVGVSFPVMRHMWGRERGRRKN